MYLSYLEVENYRNYQSQRVDLKPGVNIFVGLNAQGKTNLLEAIYLLSIGRSMRTPRDRELIRWEEKRASVKAEAVKSYGTDTVEIVIDKSLNKSIYINKLPILKIGELMGTITAVMFSPEEIKTVKESPAERRRFMDIALCQMSKNYFYLLNRYNKILAQRNKILKEGAASEDSLYAWDMQLVKTGAKIIKSRRGFIDQLSAKAEKIHDFLTSGKEKFSLLYESEDGSAVEEIEKNLYAEILRTREIDLRLKFTHAGPQKDDIKISADNVDLRSFGSQGQQRTAALTLKLAQLELTKEHTGESPLLLLDDVMSELDSLRRERLLQFTASYQTVITCTDEIIFPPGVAVKRFKVQDGKAL